VAFLQPAVSLVINARNSANGTNPAAVAQDYYLLERVGFQSSGASQQPRSPHTKKAKCLTAGKADRKGGLALGWDTCQDTVTQEKITNLAALEAQSFKLLTDGTVVSKKSGFCIRRMLCTEGGTAIGHMYDLGPCRSDISLRIKVEKSQANSMDHMRNLGYLSHAVALELCDMCGPYRLQNMCLGSADCGRSYQAKPGWTKLASQYVGEAAITGHSDYGGEAGGLGKETNIMGIDLSGIGPTQHKDGLCGSYATDSPTLSSFYYVLKADKQR